MRSIELLPLTRPWPPAAVDTESKLASPDCTDQACPSEAVPHPPEADRPAKVSRARAVPPATGVPPGVGDGVGEGVGLGLGEGVGLGLGRGVGDGDGVGLGVGVGDAAKKSLIGVAAESLLVNGARPHDDSMVLSSE
jgi:hypothetical protein